MGLSARRASLLQGRGLTLGGLFAAFWPQISVTWALTLIEVALFALIPLLIGRAIDGLIATDMAAFWMLAIVLAVLLLVATGRRLFDTRAYGVMRVSLGSALAERSKDRPVSTVNARLAMSRELVDFLETEAPESMTGVLQMLAAIAILSSFHPTLGLIAGAALVFMLAIYGLAHRRFYKINQLLNAQSEKQVSILETRSLPRLGAHLLALRKSEVRLSDTEALVYGLIFAGLLSLVLFNLWFATQNITITAGTVFAVVTYSWEFVDGALFLPTTLQSLSRLSEITRRINQTEASE